MGYLSLALAIGTPLIEGVANVLYEESKRWRRELQQEQSEADRQREEAVLSAVTQIVEIINHVFIQNEEAAPEREDAALPEADKATEALRQGIRPVAMPTPEQFCAAIERIQYNPEKIHFAVCGVSGSGKSTLINAIRGLGHNGHGAACVGETECASKITRYPDPRKQVPYARVVWYDIPGAGTEAVPGLQYFNDQELFVFEFIILVYDVRFTAIEVGVIKNCLRFNIPVFIVRSKADDHIANMMPASLARDRERDYMEVYRENVEKYIEATRSDFDKHMQTMAEGPELDAREKQMLLGQRVYIVAAETLRVLLDTTPRYSRWIDRSEVIDESLLIDDVKKAAVRVLPLLRPLDQAK